MTETTATATINEWMPILGAAIEARDADTALDALTHISDALRVLEASEDTSRVRELRRMVNQMTETVHHFAR